MAKRSFIAEFLVRVSSINLHKTKVDNERLANSVDRVAEANANANNKAKNFYNTQEKGVIGTANSTKSFSKLAETMGSGGNTSLVGIYATLAANVFAASAAFNQLRSAAQVQQVMQGLDAAGSRLGLTLSITANNVRNLAQGMLTSEQAFRSTAQFMAGGFKTDQLEQMTVLARDVSIALGRNMTDSMDRLTRGVLKLEPELLDELGIMTKLGDATKMYAAELGKPEAALSQLERRQAFMNAVLAEGQLKFGGLADAAGDTAGYDKLAASFSDLVKDVVNGINVVALPLANFFSNTKAGMLGLVVLFASSIRSQLLPMFNNLGAAAENKANIIRDQTIKTIGAWGDTLSDSHNDVKQWVDEVEKGTARVKEFDTTLASVTKEIDDYNAAIARTKEGSKKNIKLTGERDTLIDIQKQMREYERTTHKATGHARGSSAINSIAGGEFRLGVQELYTSFAHFDKSLPESATRLQKLGVAANKTAIGFRALGAGFIRILPYIGTAITVWGILSTLIGGKISPKQKELNTAQEEYGTILEAVGEKVKEYNRIQNSMASAASRVVAATKLQSNALSELMGKFGEVQRLQEEILEQQNRASNRRVNTGVGRGASFANERGLNAADMNTLKQMRAQAAGYDPAQLFSGLDEEAIKLGKSLKALDEEGWKKQIDSIGAAAIATADQGAQFKMLTALGNKITDDALKRSTAIQTTADAFKEAEDAVSQFMISAAPTTPFDNLAQGAFNSEMAVRQLQVEFERGIITAEQYSQSLSGIGERFQSLVSIDASKLVAEFNQADMEVQRLRNNPMANPAQIAQAEAKRRDIGRELVSVVKNQVILAGQQTIELQKQTRILDGQIKLEQALHNSVKSIYSLNGKGMLEQFAHEEKMRSLQVERLKLQMNLYENIIAQNKARVTEIELLKEQSFQVAYAAKVQAMMIEVSAKSQLIRNNGLLNEQQKNEQILALIKSKNVYEEARAESARMNVEYDIQIAKLMQGNSAAEATLINLRNEANAILAENLTLAQKNSRAAEKDYQVTQKYVALLKEQANLITNIENTNARIDALLSNQTDDLFEQARLIQRNTSLQIQQLRVDYVEKARELAVSKEVLKADIEAAKAKGQSAEGAKLALENINKELVSQQRLNELKIINLAVTEKLQLYELVVFDSRKQGLEWQKEGLELQRKALDTEKELSNKLLENAQARERIARIRNNGVLTEDFNKSQEVEVAIQAHRLAIAELSVRETMIDLEYALMDAQRVALREELLARKSILMQLSNLTEENPYIQQLNKAIENLNKGPNLEQVASNAKAIVRQEIEGMRLGLEELSLTSMPENLASLFMPLGGVSDALKLMAAKQGAAAQSLIRPMEAAQNTIAKATSETIPHEIQKIPAELKEPLPVMVELSTHMATVAKNTTELVKLAGGTGAPANLDLSGGAVKAAAAAGRWVQSQGFKVWEHPEFGGVTRKHQGRAHYEGRAIDVYSREGTGEWDDPAERARYDRLKVALEQIGAKVYWGVKGHFDHLHAEFPKHFDGSQVNAILQKELPGIRVATEETAHNIDSDVVNQAGTAAGNSFDSINVPTVNISSGAQAVNDNQLLPTNPTVMKNIIASIESAIPPALTFRDTLNLVSIGTSSFIEKLKELGPEGELVASLSAGMLHMSYVTDSAFKVFNNSASDSKDKIVATLAVVSAGLSTITQIVSGAADARVAAIEREIEAEQRRDGKSAESVAKLQSLEQKKDQIRRKEFNTNKKLNMASAIVNTAAGITSALKLPPPLNFIMAGIIGAMGAAQLAIIAGTSYQSTSAPSLQNSTPNKVSVGRRGDSVDLARSNPNAGGEIGYLRGAQGYGRNSADYRVIGSAYGGPLPRGYGNTAFAVGEHGPEVIEPDLPVTVRPVNSTNSVERPLPPVNFNIQALDAKGVEEILYGQRGNIIGMLREAANANGQRFLEDVDTNVYTKPNVSRL